MRIRWVIPEAPPTAMFPAGTRQEEFDLDLGEAETEMLRSYYVRIKDMGATPERTALIGEVRVMMDMIALLDAEIVEPTDQEVADAPGQPVPDERRGADAAAA